ncbi:unnamed protein product [Prorocentrum cordatum]|uniref:RNA-directed RNA polymerase n=1 Tax=Prorocentrum cordatum TaxID=2364126 RepID=A0ABN9WJA4_9DINO|nr:unnamed protein product [Polarella glacialis]
MSDNRAAPRELLPLPIPPSWSSPSWPRHRCRRLQQRFDRRKAVLSRAVDSVKALNWLHGGRQPPSFSSPTLSQATALQHLLDVHRTDVPEIVNAEAARVELLGAGQDYAGGPELPIASYDKDLLSMPQLGAEPVDLSTVLEGRARECLVNFEEEILHGPDDWGHITECEEHVRPYMDPVLKSDADAYFGFVMRGHRSGLFRFGRTPRVIVTPFFVKKKAGTLRLILDCRPSNRRMRESPYVRLGGPADVARLWHSRSDGDPYVALGDVKDYFHCCGLPPGLSPYFSLPPVSGLRLLQAGIHNVEGIPVLPGDSIFPQSRVVPMGWSWACYFAQSATTSLVHRFSGSEGDSFLESCKPPPGLDRPAYKVYIDDISIFGQGKSQTDRIAKQVFDGVESVGFRVHERTSASKWALTLGLEIDFLHSTVQGKRQKRWKLKAVLDWLSGAPYVSGKEIERLLGHTTFHFGPNRLFLSIFNSAYDFIRSSYTSRVRLWPSVARECWAAGCLISFAFADLGRGFDPLVSCFDASTCGAGVVTAPWDSAQVRSECEWEERWRFKWDVYDRVAPRDNNFSSLDWGDIESVKPCRDRSLLWSLDKSFREVPKENLVGPTWTKVVRSFWKDEEPIFCLEARAGLLAVRHKLRAVSSFGKTHLHLGDSMTAILAFEKGRAKHRGLLGACRRLLALSVASNTRHHFRWVPSELNPSDPDSRYFELPVDSDGRRLLRRSTSRAWTAQADGKGSWRAVDPGDSAFADGGRGQSEPPGAFGGPDCPDWAAPSAPPKADPLDTVLAEKTRRSARRLVLKRQRALKRVRAIGGVVPALRALKGERTVLESSHPSTPVRRDYCRRLDKFWEFGRSQGLSLANLKVCDDALCDFADLQFLDGEQVDAGAKLLAALEDHDVQRFGKPSLPRFRRVLRAWHRKGPVGSRDPLPFRLLAGILGVLSLHGFHEEVLALALMFSCYLRPSELLTVVEGDLLEPVANAGVALACWSLLLRPFEREEPTKVGQFDDTLPLDSPDFPGLGALLAGLRGGDAEVWLFSFSQTQLLRRFQAACRAAGPGSLNLEMHQLRHGGASRDFLLKTREIQAVKQRGRWANDRTLLRYMKAGRVQRLHKALTPEASRWCQEAEANLSLVLRGASLPRSLGGGFVIEVFSGSGRLAKSFAELGVPALTWDIEHGPAGDLLDNDVLRCVLSHIASGRATAIDHPAGSAGWMWHRLLGLGTNLAVTQGECALPFIDGWLDHGVLRHGSNDMKKGLSVQGLMDHEQFLTKLLSLDPRGASLHGATWWKRSRTGAF